MDELFWSTRRVVLTGASGFLGRRIGRLMVLKGIHWDGPSSRECDLTNSEAVYAYFPMIIDRNTIVIHCAANVGGIGKNREHAAEIMHDNLLMNTHALNAAYINKAQKFVGIGSVCAYPKLTPVPFNEAHLFDGYPEATNAPYGITKRALLVMGQAYRQQYFFNAIHLLVVNLYGPGDNFDLETSHVVPAIMRKMHEAMVNGRHSVTLWGDGSATRELLYVDDAAEAVLMAAEQYNSGEPVNIGSGQEISIRELAELIAEVVGYTGAIVWDATQPNGQPRRRLDTTRAEQALGFRAQMSLRDGLQKTYDWYVAEVVGV